MTAKFLALSREVDYENVSFELAWGFGAAVMKPPCELAWGLELKLVVGCSRQRCEPDVGLGGISS